MGGVGSIKWRGDTLYSDVTKGNTGVYRPIGQNFPLYSGEVRDSVGSELYGAPHGVGLVRYADGDELAGRFVDGMITGHGESITAFGHYYRGDMVRDLYHGYGEQCTGTETYSGEWYRGARNGKGRVISRKDDSVIDAKWENGRCTNQPCDISAVLPLVNAGWYRVTYIYTGA